MRPRITCASSSRPLADVFDEMAERAQIASRKLSAWGVVVPKDSRLQQAECILRSYAVQGALTPNQETIGPVLEAFWTVADFADIAEYLPPDMVRSVRVELGSALTGALWPSKGERGPLQLQSQHWVGAILHRSGVRLRHATASARRQLKIPEFYLDDGTEKIAVEVKRIESAKRVRPSIESARDKFAANECFGAIVIEVSDCITPGSLEETTEQVAALAKAAHSVVWQMPGEGLATGFKFGFSRVSCISLVSRGAWKSLYAETAKLEAYGIAFNASFATAQFSLRGLRAEWLRGQFEAAFDGIVQRHDGAEF